jgi:hypothetical protein
MVATKDNVYTGLGPITQSIAIKNIFHVCGSLIISCVLGEDFKDITSPSMVVGEYER